MREENWNIILGCTPVNAGCDNCPGERAAYLSVVCDGKWTNKIDFIDFMKKRLDQPLHWRKPRRIWLGKIGDIFQPGVKDEWLDQIFAVMALCPQHMFYIQTKRPERAKKYFSDGKDWCDGANRAYDQYIRPLSEDMFLMGEIVWPLPNVRIGVVVEDQKRANDLVPKLLEVPAAKRFVLVRPREEIYLIQYVIGLYGSNCERDCDAWENKCIGYECPDWLQGLDFVFCEGEEGPHARPCHPSWIRSLRDQCQDTGVGFVFRGWGKYHPMRWQGTMTKRGDYLAFPDGELIKITSSGQIASNMDGVELLRSISNKLICHLIDGEEYWEWPE